MEFLKSRAFPSFFKEYAPKLVEFFGAWIDWLNLKENSAYIIDHLSSENDIDESINAFKTHLKYEFVNDFPEEISADLKLLLKNIFYLYNSKSSIESYEFLFRCLFNASATISYPKNNVLKTSDGRWKIPHYIKLTDDETLVQDFEKYYSLQIKGIRSGAIGYISKIEVHSFGREDTIYNAILLESVTGEFQVEEEVIISDPETGLVIEELSGYTVEKYEIGTGRWIGTYGFLDSDMYIQDSYYYQDFSYIIKSTVPAYKWRTLVKKLLHPAGMNLFGELESSGTDEEGNDIKLPIVKSMNALDFLKFWRIIFETYVFDLSLKLEMHRLIVHTDSFDRSIAQIHSETVDKWLYDGDYVTKYGLNNIKIDEFNKRMNKHSVLMFRSNGTLINPDIINWHDFTFTELPNTFQLYGITVHPEHHILNGKVIGPDWTYHTEESVSDKNYMVFVSSTKDTSNYRIKYLKLSTVYENFTDTDPTIGESKLDDTVMTPIEKASSWRDLKLSDFVTLNKKQNEILDENSFIKVPKNRVYFDGTKYVFTDSVYEDESICVYSYSDEDISEYFCIEDPSIKTIDLNGEVSKEFVICFLDGKFNENAFTVKNGQIEIIASEFKVAEFYVLSRINAFRKEFYEHDNSLQFVYNNARLQPFMPYETKISTFKLREYKTDVKNKTVLHTVNAPIPYYRTMDKILSYSSNTDIEYAVLAGTNASSNMMFDESGYLINPETVDWASYKFIEIPNTSKLSFVLLNPTDPNIVFNLNTECRHNYQQLQESLLADIIYKSLCETDALQEYSMDSDIMSRFSMADLGELTVEDDIRIYDEDGMYASQDFNKDRIISENAMVFINNKKLYPSKYRFTDYGIEIDVSEFSSSNDPKAVVYQYSLNDYAQIIRFESANKNSFELNSSKYSKNDIIVFCNGLLTTDFYLSGKSLIFNKDITGMPIEIYVTRKTDTSGVHIIDYSGTENFVPPIIKQITYVDTVQ